MAADIFVSFASKDVRVAMTLCGALENRGFSCWISARDIEPGANFQSAIVRALRQAKIMLLVFTANSNTSEEMTKELALASQNKMIVIPLRVEDVTPNDAFAYEFATRQWIDVFADWEVAIEQLSRRIGQALLDRSAGKGGAAAEALKTVIASANAAKMADPVAAGDDAPPSVAALEAAPGGEPPIEAAVKALEALEAGVEPAAELGYQTPEIMTAPESAADAELPPASDDDLWPAAAAEAPPVEPQAHRKPVGLLIGATVVILALVGLVILLANRGGGSKAPSVEAASSTVVTPQKVATPPVAAPSPAPTPTVTDAPKVSDAAQSSLEAAPVAPKPVKHKKTEPKVDIPF